MLEQDDFLLDKLRHYGADATANDTLSLAAASLRDGTVPSAAWNRALAEPLAQAVVLSLKDDADRHWRIHWEGAYMRSLQIIAIGEARADLAIQALGTMAKGDAVKLVTGRLHEAWELLEHAGNLYRASHLSEREKEIGWARTRIGRAYICVEVEKQELAFKENVEAQQILERYEVWERLIPLYVNWAQAYNLLEEYKKSLDYLEIAWTIANRLGEKADIWVTTIYNNMALALSYLGHTKRAIRYYEQVVEWSEKRGEITSAAVARLNIGYQMMEKGRFGQALRLLYEVEPIMRSRNPRLLLPTQWVMVRCYVEVGRFEQAYRIIEQLLEETALEPGDIARAYFLKGRIATCEGSIDTALESFEKSELLYQKMKNMFALLTVQLVKARLKLQLGLFAEVLAEGIERLKHESNGTKYNLLLNYTLIAEASFLSGQHRITISAAHYMLKLLKDIPYTPYYYNAHLILGKSLAQEDPHKSRRHYQAAIAASTRLQQGLSYTLHSDIISYRQEALHQFMLLELMAGRITSAWQTLEISKNRLFFTRLQDAGQVKWIRTDTTSPLLDEYYDLRNRHFTLTVRAPKETAARDKEIETLEIRLRELVERLYLYTVQQDEMFATVPDLLTVQETLPPHSALLEYYDDGQRLWLFVVTQDGLSVSTLPIDVGMVRDCIKSLSENHLTTVTQYLPNDMSAYVQAKKARHLYKVLGEALLEPIATHLSGYERLYIVPYGALHQVAFNLLRLKNAYLIEQVEVVMLPSAALLQHKGVKISHGKRWIGYSNNGQLPYAVSEVERLQQRWGGELHIEEKAVAQVLQDGPSQILHLSTHGIHRVDHYFDRSYLRLSDQYVYGDDLLQQELPHELVTLSACEVGTSKITAGDEQIGLGRTFLYAGAGALVVSLWQVREEITTQIMDTFYSCLFSGASKAAALRQSQITLLRQQPTSHPVYWGAFQLVGNPRVLS